MSSKNEIMSRMEVLVQSEAACLDKGDHAGFRAARAERNKLEAELARLADGQSEQSTSNPMLTPQDKAALLVLLKDTRAKCKGKRAAKDKAVAEALRRFLAIGTNSRIDYAEKAEEAAGNWRGFESFGWTRHGEEDIQNWTVVYTHNRDSGLIARCNAEVLVEEFAPFLGVENADIQTEEHGHWACGWMAGYSIRVYGADGKITTAFKLWCDFAYAMEDYPILDEDRCSEMQWKEAEELVAAGCYDDVDEAYDNVEF